MNSKITEQSLDTEVKETISAYYGKHMFKRLDMIVNPAKRRIRFDVICDVGYESDNKPLYSGQSLKQAIKIYNEVKDD